jgi:hypothetical protein
MLKSPVSERKQRRNQLRAAFLAADERLSVWDKALNDPKKFKPVIKCEWDRAFDARERAAKAYYEVYPISYLKDRPAHWMSIAYLLHGELGNALLACETDSEVRRVLFCREDFPGADS